MYDNILQALAVEEAIMFLKPFLDLGFNGVIRWKSPALEMFSHTAKHVKVQVD
jgi:hypothetical protein